MPLHVLPASRDISSPLPEPAILVLTCGALIVAHAAPHLVGPANLASSSTRLVDVPPVVLTAQRVRTAPPAPSAKLASTSTRLVDVPLVVLPAQLVRTTPLAPAAKAASISTAIRHALRATRLALRVLVI
jgi:hypothetical protein